MQWSRRHPFSCWVGDWQPIHCFLFYSAHCSPYTPIFCTVGRFVDLCHTDESSRRECHALDGLDLVERSGSFCLDGRSRCLLGQQNGNREDFLQWNIASVAILLLGIANAFGILLALHASTAQDWLTANPYLHPLNAFRASHGFWLALALLPFLNAETRVHSNTTKHFLFSMTLTLLCRLFGWRFGTRSLSLDYGI